MRLASPTILNGNNLGGTPHIVDLQTVESGFIHHVLKMTNAWLSDQGIHSSILLDRA